jgi:hypothetical protein
VRGLLGEVKSVALPGKSEGITMIILEDHEMTVGDHHGKFS